jgi:hypothetical protein
MDWQRCEPRHLEPDTYQAAEKTLISEAAATLRRHNFNHCHTHLAA